MNKNFSLENAITEWRRQMLAAGIETPVPLEELEAHLRDEIERLMEAGTNPQPAFENSVRQMGQADELKGEFKKVCGMKDFPQLSRWSLFWTGVSLLAVTVLANLFSTLILRLATLFGFHSSALVFLSHQSWTFDYVMFATFTINGLVMGLARWHTKWTLLWISSIGLIDIMTVVLVGRFGFHRSDWAGFSLQRAELSWGWFYVTWMIFVGFSLVRGRFRGFVARKLHLKATSD